MIDESISGPARWFGHLLGQLAGGIRAKTTAALAPLGLNPVLLGCMEAISAAGPIPQVTLGQMVRVDRTTIVQLVDTLEAAGLAARRPAANDRRVHAVALTDDGRARLEQARHAARGAEEEFLAPLSAGERATMLAALRTLYAARIDASCGS